MSIVLVVRLTAQLNKAEELAEVLKELAVESRQEPGCELYIRRRIPRTPTRSFSTSSTSTRRRSTRTPRATISSGSRSASFFAARRPARAHLLSDDLEV